MFKSGSRVIQHRPRPAVSKTQSLACKGQGLFSEKSSCSGSGDEVRGKQREREITGEGVWFPD